MRTGGYTIQQTLTTESASVLKHSLTLARRRGHAQVTPLHVAATLLSSRTSLLRRACIKSHPGFSTNYQFATSRLNHPLQCRALELCFNVALNRLPTVPAPIFHGQPSLANALIAALKRAQAHQRRGCIEQQQTQTQTQTQQQQQQQQQPQLLAVKVELEQLVISILDDPSVSRVMREAGFNSTAVKNCVEDCSVVSSVFYGFSSPNSPNNDHQTLNRFPHYQKPKDFNFINPNFTLWQTHFLNHSSDNQIQNPLLIPSSHHHYHNRLRDTDVKLVVDVLVNKKRKNPVIIGDSTSFIEGFVSELIIKLERGEIDELKQTHFIKFQFSPISSKFMRREDVEMNIRELRKKVISFTSSGKNVIIYTGDLNWTIKEINNNGGIREISSSYSPVDHIVEELGKLIAEYNDKLDDNDGDDDDNDDDDDGVSKVWVMGTGSFQTYMRCQMRQPSLETLWALLPVSVPSSSSATLGLSLHATSVHEGRNMSSNVTSQVTESKFNKAEEETRNSVLSCCLECVSSYEKEAKTIKVNREKLLPSWLLPNNGDNSLHKEELMGLRRKWNKFCESNHQSGQLSLLGNNFSYGFPYGSSRSSSLMDSLGLKPNQRVVTNSIAKFRRQNSCTIEFDLGGNEFEKGESMNEVEDTENVKITLDLGNSLFRSDSGTERRKMSDLVKTLQENIPSKTENIRLISECVMDCVSKKKDGWIIIEGSDVAAKRKLARIVSESVFGSVESLLHLDLKKRSDESMEIFASGLKNREKVVFLIEDIDSGDVNFLKLLADRFEENQRGEFGKDRQGIFILTKEESDLKNRDFVVQIGLEITEQSLEKKRKRSEFVIKREVYSKQSSFGSSLDLNIKAEEEEDDDEGEISPISSDLTRDETEISSSDFLNRIENRFVLDRECEPEMKKEMTCRITAAFREIFPEKGEEYGVVRFSVEERLVEEVCGYVQNGAFESWLKEVFQRGLLTVQKGGKKDRVVIRMVFGGIVDNKQYGGVGGYMGTCLPNKVQISKFE